MASSKRYFGLSWIVCLILAILPPTNIICGIVTRIQRGHVIAGLLNIPLCFIFYFVDLVTMALKRDITFYA